MAGESLSPARRCSLAQSRARVALRKAHDMEHWQRVVEEKRSGFSPSDAHNRALGWLVRRYYNEYSRYYQEAKAELS